MADQAKKAASKYQQKIVGKITPTKNTKPRRQCMRCPRSLTGKKGHGFVGSGGKIVLCSFCAFPHAKPKRTVPNPEPFDMVR